MAKILSMDNKTAAIDDYIDEYTKMSKAAQAAQWLFAMMDNVFLNVCEDINIDESLFSLDKECADTLFAQTMNWVFPSVDKQRPDNYKLSWEWSGGQYTYTIDVVFPVDLTTLKDNVIEYASVERISDEYGIEYWDHKQKCWHNKVFRITPV